MSYLDPQKPNTQLPEKNLLLNGDFNINQRQFASIFVISGFAECHDRWSMEETDDGSTENTPLLNQAIATGIVGNSLRCRTSLADTGITGSEYRIIRQLVEGPRVAQLQFGTANAKTVTLSFWHKHSQTGTHCVALQNGAEDRSYVAEYTQAVADTWEFQSITIPGDTAGTWLVGAAQIGLRVIFAHATGSGFEISAGSWQAALAYGTSSQVNNMNNVNDNFELARVQLEVGSDATEFEKRDVATELMQCKRFFQSFEGFQGIANATTEMEISMNFPVEFAAAPTSAVIRFNNTTTGDELTMDDGTTAFTQSAGGITLVEGLPNAMRVRCTLFSGLTVGQSYNHVPDGVVIQAQAPGLF